MPTMSFCWSFRPACSTAWLAYHFLPVLVSIPALRIELSCDCLSVTTSRVFATLNSSTSDDSGGCSLLDRPYNPMLVKLIGTPSHRRRCLLIVLAKHSAEDVVILYSIRGHISLGRSAFCKSHALNLPCKADLSICFSPSWSCDLMLSTFALSLRLDSNHLFRHSLGLSIIDGMSPPWTCRVNHFVTDPRLITRLLDFLGLKFILAQVAASSNAFSTHLTSVSVLSLSDRP
ncbi:hypothetical protein DPMN_175210 [Dreissena polymorpha]|uniref:Secreted protein n=1 Tax=Dreissena polymorpha TaxID=45954 RepID=A0A9D4IHW3_DREPO|nr:hypothetical protein DPMN_175210 [Dreissena polymorpha]